MYNYYYIDVNNRVIGYDNIEDIKHLIKIGIITPQTKIYNRYGKEISKNQILNTQQTKQNFFTDNISDSKNTNNNNSHVNFTNSMPIEKFLKALSLHDESSYPRISEMIIILEILSKIFLYLGTLLSTIVSIIIYHYFNIILASLTLFSGLIASVIFWLLLGFGADLLKLKLNIAADLNEIKKAAQSKEE
jgi:cellulose synthase/poly-beta-1,6-N-acetylglucosamine synthase-like glycosyltransferase